MSQNALRRVVGAFLHERKSAMNTHSRLQRKKSSDMEREGVPQLVHDTLRSGGQPLNASVRAFMEPRFGHDFGQVRVHTDGQAAESAEAVSALAYTAGRDIVFGAGQYQPHSDAGKRLLAHELAHVVQQASGPVSGVPIADGLAVSEPGDGFEREADHTADRVMAADYAAGPAVIASGPSALTVMTMQRCGDTPCNCSAEERLAHEMDDMQMQRLAVPGTLPTLWLQRRVVCDPQGSEACWEEDNEELSSLRNSALNPQLTFLAQGLQRAHEEGNLSAIEVLQRSINVVMTQTDHTLLNRWPTLSSPSAGNECSTCKTQQLQLYTLPQQKLQRADTTHTTLSRKEKTDGRSTLQCINANLANAGVPWAVLFVLGGICSLLGTIATSPTGPGAVAGGAAAAALCIASVTGLGVGMITGIIIRCIQDPSVEWIFSEAETEGSSPEQDMLEDGSEMATA
jgi:hypothetical protein